MISCVTWKWGNLFAARHVNALREGLERHLHLDHQLVCITDDPTGIDPRVRIVPLPDRHNQTPRCRRRMRIFDGHFAHAIGDRLLCLDLDVVIVDDLTPIVDRWEPLVCWKVKHARVYSGSFFLMDCWQMDGLWKLFDADPEGFPRKVQGHGVPSDQAMLNFYLRGQTVPTWTERDGFVTYFGAGYEHKEHFGVGPTRTELPAGARIVVLGSADNAVLDDGAYPWVRAHWPGYEVAA